MQYMLMIFDDPKRIAQLPEAQRREFQQAYADFTQGLVKSGHFRAGAQLQPVSAATVVRAPGGKLSTTDGPFVETKEHLGGYYLVECKDLDEAVAIAARVPSVALSSGAVEVRPLVPTSEAARTPPAR